MKNITNKLLSALLALAIIVTGIMIPSNVERVEAASKISPADYDNYDDFYEAWILSRGGVRKSVNDVDDVFNNKTVREGAEFRNFVIPDDCVELLCDGYAYMGYKTDGTKVRILRKTGYDAYNGGYDKDGYNRSGYDVNGYDKDGNSKNSYSEDSNDKEKIDIASKIANSVHSSYHGFYQDLIYEGSDNRMRSLKNKDAYSNMTVREAAESRGFVIPDDCVRVLYSHSLNAYLGYRADGTDMRILKTNGYDVCGYDKDGYDKNGYDWKGYDKEGYDKEGYDKEGYNKKGYDKLGNHKKYNAYRNSLYIGFYRDIVRDAISNISDEDIKSSLEKHIKKLAYVCFSKGNYNYYANIEEEVSDDNYYSYVSEKDYTVKVKTIAKKSKTCPIGIYDVTVTMSKKYKNIKLSKRVMITPVNAADLYIKGTKCYVNGNNAYKDAKYDVEYTIYKSTKTTTQTINGKKTKIPVINNLINNEKDKVVKTGKFSAKANAKTKQFYNIGKKNKAGEYYYIKYRISMKVGDETIKGLWVVSHNSDDTKIRVADEYREIKVTDEYSVITNWYDEATD